MAWSPFAASKPRVAGLVLATVLSVCVSLWTQAALAGSGLASYLPKVSPVDFFPGADRFGPPQGDPPDRARLQGRSVAGFRLPELRLRQRDRLFRQADPASGRHRSEGRADRPQAGRAQGAHRSPGHSGEAHSGGRQQADRRRHGQRRARSRAGAAGRYRQRRDGDRPGDGRQHRPLRDQADQERPPRRSGQRGRRLRRRKPQRPSIPARAKFAIGRAWSATVPSAD